ncbi:MAG TPA: S9 family peptidase [Pyrinomonadaceae bacterium]|jgi:dipeptidyl aminopeptidase/acylaminoacyl peptidase
MRSTAIRFLLLCLTLTSVSALTGAQKRNITEKDLFDFVWVADPEVSPDESTVAFVKVTVNDKRDSYNTSIWSVSTSTGESHQMTSGIHDSSPRWSPDGRYLAFVRVTEKDGRPDTPQLFMLPMAGGDSWQFTSMPRGAGGIGWSPDGKWIVFGNSQTEAEIARGGKPVPPSADGHESDVKVITRAGYRSNGAGYLDFTHPGHIWVVAAPRSSEDNVMPKELTSGNFSQGGAVWAPDSSRVYYTTNRNPEPYYELGTTEVWSVSPAGGQPLMLTKVTTMGFGGLSISPDGKRFALLGSANEPVRSYTKNDLWVLDIAPNAQPKNLTGSMPIEIGSGGIGGDQAPPRGGGGGGVIWAKDGKSLIVEYGKEGRSQLTRFDPDSGKVTDLTKGDQTILNYNSVQGGGTIAYTVSTPTRISDLYVMNGSGTKQLTHVNDALFSKLNLTEPEEIKYKSFDGKTIEAWVQKPPDFDPSKKYPLILNIHGGPHTAYGYVFDHEFQWMAAKGYVVLYPNPRGSTSYGQDFGNIIQYHYPGDDYKDLMAGVDELIKRGYIDEKKLGVTGGSGGGLLTDWTVTQTQRFAAAVAQRDITNWADWWYTADFRQFEPSWFKGAPFEQEDDYKARSPITYVKNITTPMMFILGEADYRTPPGAGGEQFFVALKYRHIPTVMVRFPNESHELSRSGQPWHRIERLEHIVGWFDHWLMGVPKPEYEVALQ